MYTNLLQEDSMILDMEFFKLNNMFENVNKIYAIQQKELEYSYIYTENINEEYIDLYTEAEEAKDRKEQGLLGRLFTAILNFIRKIRAKILRLFGNDKKATELEAKIKGNPKLANQTVEITNTLDAEKAIDEGTSFFGSLIDKIVKGTATEKDADDAEEKNKSLLSRIAIFGGEALLAAGGAKVASDKLKERGVTKQTIKETVSNLFKREEDTKKKSNEVTQTNEQNVQKAQQAMNNNSQSGNEENTKAGRRIVGSFKDFITGAGKFFTGKASEIRSKINGVSSNNNDDNTGDNKGSSISSGKSNNIEGKYDVIEQCLAKNDVEGLRNVIGSLCYTSMDFSSGEFDAAIKYVESKGIKLKESYNGKPELILNKKKLSECTEDDFGDAVFELKENFCTERINEVKKIGKYVYGPGGKAKNNDDKKKDSTKDEQQTSTSQARPKNTNTQQVNDKQQTLTSQERPKNTNTQQANDKQNQKNDNKQQNQSIDYRKDFAERLLKHESIDTVPTLKTELERIIKNGKYTDEEYKRMGEIEDRLQFEMILQKVYDDRDKLNSNDQKILDTLIKKTNITANDDKELTILLNKVQDAKYNEKKKK